MRFVALAVVLLTFPAFIAWLGSHPHHRKYAFLMLGVSFFLSGIVQIEASAIAWPFWNGTAKGMTISMIDTLALSLIITRPSSRIKIPLTWAMVGYLITAIISMFPADVPVASFFYVFQIVRMLILATAIAPELRDQERLRWLLNGLAVGLIIQGGYVAYEKLRGVLQATGTMVHQNTLGMMVELAMLPILAALLGGQRSTLLKIGVVAGLIIVAGGGSRATMAIVGIASVALVIIAIIQSPSPAKSQIAGLGIIAAILIAPLGYKTLTKRFAGTVNLEEDQQRIAMEKAAREMSNDNFFGVGANLYVTTANTKGYSQRSGVGWGGHTRSAPVHNAFLLARAETGWIGELFFTLLFAAPFVAGVRYAFRFRRGLDGTLALGSAVALAASAYHSRYEFATQTVGPQGLLFINIGIIAGMIMLRKLKPGVATGPGSRSVRHQTHPPSNAKTPSALFRPNTD